MTIAQMEDNVVGLLREIQRKMVRTNTTSVGVMVNIEYRATPFFLEDNKWRLDSPERSYTKKDPPVDYLVRKYAKLMDPNFLIEVGKEPPDHDDDEAHIPYEDKVNRYINRYRDKLLQGLISTLSKVLMNLPSKAAI